MLVKSFIGTILFINVIFKSIIAQEDEKVNVRSVWGCVTVDGKMECQFKTIGGGYGEDDVSNENCGSSSEQDFDDDAVHEVDAVEEPPPFIQNEDGSLQGRLLRLFKPETERNIWEEDTEKDQPLPGTSFISKHISARGFFTSLNQSHMQAVAMAETLFKKERDPAGVLWLANGLLNKRRIHSKVWYEGLVKAYLERDDMAGLEIPGPLDAIPDAFIPAEAFRGRAGGTCYRLNGDVGKDNGVENALWYFREDLMVNAHHMYWHLLYPSFNKGRKRDRRGEVFYFLHKTMLARYDIERLCNGMEFTKALVIRDGAVLKEGYNSHLDDHNSGQKWTSRPSNISLKLSSDETKKWLRMEERLQKAVDTGIYVNRDGHEVKFSSYEGIDQLVNTIEASEDLTVNAAYYDTTGYHNTGHLLISKAADGNRNNPPPGVLKDTKASMRDPIFYRWHVTINNFFDKLKSKLEPYKATKGDFPLLWKGVSVVKVDVIGKERKEGPRNELLTFFRERKIDLSLGLAYNFSSGRQPLKLCVEHLDHEEFEYEITVDRQSCAISKSGKMTVRIFIAPRNDLEGRRLSMEQQRRLFVHLDLFQIKLDVGRSIILRRSIDSTLTIPWTKSMRQLEGKEGAKHLPHCGCGWPSHLLLPRGTPQGTPFDLFVMVTNADGNPEVSQSSGGSCHSAPLLCGIPNQKYPDKHPMGYPFDRTSASSYQFLEDFMRGYPNMASTQVVIRHRRVVR